MRFSIRRCLLPATTGFMVVMATLSAAIAGENYALLVAVGSYDVKELRPLKFTRADILEFHQALVDSGFAPKNIALMHDDLKQLVSHYEKLGPDYDPRNYLPDGANTRK